MTVSFTAPNDGEWHQYTTDIETSFDMEVTDLVGLHIRTPLSCASEIDYKNLSFTKGSPEPDDSSFAKEMAITFTGFSGTELTNFPVLVRLSQNLTGFSYADFSLPDGGDLRFFDAGGNLLAHEIDTWNPNGVSTVFCFLFLSFLLFVDEVREGDYEHHAQRTANVSPLGDASLHTFVDDVEVANEEECC